MYVRNNNKGRTVNIWFAANIAPESSGGIARSMREFAQGLQSRGHLTELYFRKQGGSDNYLWFTVRLGMRLLMRAKNPPDWIIARSSDGFVSAVIAGMLRLKTKVALHNHGWEEMVIAVERRLPRSIVSHPTTWRAALVRLPLLRATLALSACCLSGTLTETRRLAARYPRYRQKMRYIPNGVFLSQDTKSGVCADTVRTFLAVGGWTWKKNIEHTLAVFNLVHDAVPSARLVLAGATEKNDIAAMKSGGYIETLGAVDPGRMTELYVACPYLLVSSRYEGGHSFAILEALSHGCIVFATKIPSTMEIIKDRVNGIFISGCDAEGDAEIIISVLRRKELLHALSKQAKSTAFRNRWQRQVERLEKVLCRL